MSTTLFNFLSSNFLLHSVDVTGSSKVWHFLFLSDSDGDLHFIKFGPEYAEVEKGKTVKGNG